MKDSANDDHWMRAHDVDYSVPAKLPEMVSANHGVFMVFPHVIYSRFELNEIVDVGMPFRRPVHSTNDAAKRKSSRGIATGDLFECLKHPILIESAIAKVNLGIDFEFELAAVLRFRRVHSCGDQPLQVLASLARIDDVNGLVTAREPVLNKGKQYSIFFFFVVKKAQT